MKHCLSIACAFLCVLFLSSKLNAQIDLPSNTLVTQNFNSIGSSATASLPPNWKMSSASEGLASGWATGTNITATTQAANSGTPATGGAYNWGTTAGTDRAIGFITSLSYLAPNSVMAFFRNTTGAPATSITVSYALERYRIDSANFILSLYWSLDGVSWNNHIPGDISSGVFAPGAEAYTFASPQRVTKTVSITGLNIANNGSFYLRWLFGTAGAVKSQGLGLDDVSIYANTAPVIVAELKDALTIDNGAPNQVNPGDEITYTTKIKNIGTGNANNVVLTQPAPANTTLVPGSVKTSALASNDNYVTPVNTALTGNNVLTNDYGIPAVNVLSFGPTSNAAATAAGGSGTSDQGGTVVVNSNGSFTYTPPAAFNGTDKFAYIAGNGNLPNNDAVVSIIVGGVSPAPVNDAYNVIGNVSIVPDAAAGVLANDAGTLLVVTAVNGSGANVGVPITTTGGGRLTVNADGSFSYNPPAGVESTDNFTYTAANGLGSPATSTVTLNIAGMIWFINNGGPAGDGRLSNPFNSIAAFQAINNGAGNNPAVNDNIFLFESSTDYVTAADLTLLNGQKLVGQDATATLAAITGLTPDVYTTPFPVMNTGAPAVTLTTTVGAFKGITLGQNNIIRGLTVGNTTGTKIFGNNFGTLRAGDIISPDVTLSGGGQIMNLKNGSFNASSGFASVATTGTAASQEGITFTTVGGTVSFASTNIANTTMTAIFIFTSSVTMNFGNTTISNCNGGVWLRQNTGGSRTFGTLTISGGIGYGFRSLRGGLSVTGATTISNTATWGILLENVAQSVTFGATSITNTGGIAASLGSLPSGGNSGPITFSSLDINMNGGIGLFSYENSNIAVINPDGAINMNGGEPIYIDGHSTTANLNFSAINGLDIILINTDGTINGGTGSLTGSSSNIINISRGTVSFNYAGNLTQTSYAPLLHVANHSIGTITLSGTLSATTGTGLQFDNADGIYNFTGTTTLNGGDAGIDIITGSSGTFNFANPSGSFSITNPTGTAFNCTASSPTVVFKGNITQNNASRMVAIDGAASSSINFASGTISGGAASTGILINNTNATISFTNIAHGTTGARTANQSITITNGTGIYNLGTLGIFTNTQSGLVITNADGSVNCTNGIINTTNGRAINIDGPAGLTTLGLALTEVSSTGSATNGIFIQNVNGTFSVTGDNTNTNNGSGGSIQGMSQHGIYFSNPTGGGLAVILKNINVSGAPASYSNILFDAPTSGSFNNSDISYCTVDNAAGTGIRANIQGTSMFSRITIRNCSFTGNDVGIDLVTNGTAVLRFDVRNNIMNGIRTQVNIANNDATPNNGVGPFMEGYIVNNNITTSPTGSAFTGVGVIADGDGSIIADISGNSINDFGASGIAVESRGGSGRVDATIQNNVVSGTATAPLTGIFLRSGNGTVSETSKLYVYLLNNNVNGGAGATADYYLDRFTAPSTTFAIQGLTPDPATPAQAQTFVISTDAAPPATAFVNTGTYIAGAVFVPSF